jgi:predicted RNA-binding protein with PIN domain
MSSRYIIDAYNIIKHPLFRPANKKIKDEKIALLDFISSNRLTGSPKNTVIAVFDGYPQLDTPKEHSGIDVLFSRGETADELIKRLVERSANPKAITVVSDDKEIQITTKFSGASIMNVEDFIRPKEKFQKDKEGSVKPELTYSLIHKINQELREIWLK